MIGLDYCIETDFVDEFERGVAMKANTPCSSQISLWSAGPTTDTIKWKAIERQRKATSAKEKDRWIGARWRPRCTSLRPRRVRLRKPSALDLPMGHLNSLLVLLGAIEVHSESRKRRVWILDDGYCKNRKDALA